MGREQLAFLIADDWALLMQGSRRASYHRGEVILAEGAQRRALFIVAHGFVRVERGYGGGGMTVAQLGPGEIFGEMSFLEESGASASVIAREDVDVDVVEDLYLNSLLSSTPAFAVRFYQSLAINLSRRLRQTIQRLTEATERAQSPAQRLHIVRTGDISARQIPPELRAAMASFDAAMAQVDQHLAGNSLPAGVAQDRVGAACHELVRLLDRYTQDASLVEIGWADLLAFRDTPQLASGVGDYIFRRSFSTIMLSATMARCYAKPRGIAADFETLELIDNDDPDGDDRLGPLVDRWFLARPLCRSRRHSRHLMAALIAHYATDASPGPLHVTSLASGATREIIDLYAGETGLRLITTCIDADEDALLRARTLGSRLGTTDSMTFVADDVMAIVLGNERFALPPQDLIYALWWCDYLSDDEIVMLLNWAHGHLRDGGAVVVTNLDPSNPDRAFMEHILKWPATHRTAESITALFAQSAFAGRPLQMQMEDAGVTRFALCSR